MNCEALTAMIITWIITAMQLRRSKNAAKAKIHP